MNAELFEQIDWKMSTVSKTMLYLNPHFDKTTAMSCQLILPTNRKKDPYEEKLRFVHIFGLLIHVSEIQRKIQRVYKLVPVVGAPGTSLGGLLIVIYKQEHINRESV